MENQIGPGVGRLQREHSLLDKGTRSADPDARQTWLVFGEQQEALGMEKTGQWLLLGASVCLPGMVVFNPLSVCLA